MRRIEMMTAGGVTLAGLGVLVGLALGSGDTAPKLLAPRTQPVEVRTEVIRKTVNVYRRARPHHVAGSGPGGAGSSKVSALGSSTGVSAAARTRSSGVRTAAPVGPAAPVVRTSSSGSKSSSGASSSEASRSQPVVRTRTSGGGSSGGSTGSSHAVTTRSSGGGEHGDKSGGRDD